MPVVIKTRTQFHRQNEIDRVIKKEKNGHYLSIKVEVEKRPFITLRPRDKEDDSVSDDIHPPIHHLPIHCQHQSNASLFISPSLKHQQQTVAHCISRTHSKIEGKKEQNDNKIKGTDLHKSDCGSL